MSEVIERKFYLKEFKAISHAISSYEDLTLLINHIVEGLSRTFKLKGCCIMLFDEREKQLFHVGSHGISEAYIAKGPVVVDEKYSNFLKGESIFIEDLRNDPRVQYPEEALKENIISMVSLPIKYRNSVIGLVRLYHSSTIKLNEEDIDSILVLAQQLGLVIENNGLRNFLEEVKGGISRLPLHMLEGLYNENRSTRY
ncbi:MAG: GAF domain-containing protein [Desulfobacterales bacterium]|nr:GAF domain-containing protein [Desulfobacterales bacterium]MBF0395621.1 GAF domain-containing protein [Desulfobacterales bacterium]